MAIYFLSLVYLRGHLDFGVCQSGTSGLIFDDENAVIGAPGTMTWRGAVFVFSVTDDYLNRDKMVYVGNGSDIGEATLPNERITKFGYMGEFIEFFGEVEPGLKRSSTSGAHR